MDKTRSAKRRKAEGAHYTPATLAAFVAKNIVRAWNGDGRYRIKLLDPAVGDGSLLVALITELRNTYTGPLDVEGFDTSSEAIARAREAISVMAPSANLSLRAEDFLDAVAPAVASQDSLFSGPWGDSGPVDMVIANPPYVRTQVMGAERSQRLAASFDLAGRVDLSFAFIRALGRVLKPDGVAGIIVSNRFMTTRAGASLRESIKSDFDILSVYDFGDTRLFEAAVLPAVLILRRRSGKGEPTSTNYVSIYSTRDETENPRAIDAFQAIETAGRYQLPSGESFEVKHGRLDTGPSPGAVWRLATDEGDDWLARVASNTAMTFADVGPIRVGVKTTADKIFIRSDWDELPPDERPELLRPIITHHRAQRFRSVREIGAPQVLYTHTVAEGRRVPVDLGAYPNAARYLERHRERLEGRSYVTEAGRAWYEIWVPQDPEAWILPKLVFRDIAEEPMFWIDREGSVVNGDCYWLAVDEGRVDLLYLAAAVGNSTFIEAFYDHRFNNKLYAGRRRFITQYVQEFPLPNPDSEIARRMVEISKHLCDSDSQNDSLRLATELDRLTWQAFGLRGKE